MPNSNDEPSARNTASGRFSGTDDFSDQATRMVFVRKVYSILSVMSIVWSGITLFFTLNNNSKVWIAKNPAIFWISLIFSVVSLFTLACCGSFRRRYPTNFVCLAIFTIIQGLLFGCIAAFFQTKIVVFALGITVVVCVAITAFSFQTKLDFTYCSGFALVTGIVFFLFPIIWAFLRLELDQIIASALVAIIFAFYLIIDTKLIINGEHWEKITPDEYLFGAITLFSDVINIFLYCWLHAR